MIFARSTTPCSRPRQTANSIVLFSDLGTQSEYPTGPLSFTLSYRAQNGLSRVEVFIDGLVQKAITLP